MSTAALQKYITSISTHLHLPQGLLSLCFRLCMYQIRQPLHLRQIKLPVEERPLCKVSRLSMSATWHLAKCLKGSKNDGWPTVSLKLNRIFSSEAMRTYKMYMIRRWLVRKVYERVWERERGEWVCRIPHVGEVLVSHPPPSKSGTEYTCAQQMNFTWKPQHQSMVYCITSQWIKQLGQQSLASWRQRSSLGQLQQGLFIC